MKKIGDIFFNIGEESYRKKGSKLSSLTDLFVSAEDSGFTIKKILASCSTMYNDSCTADKE